MNRYPFIKVLIIDCLLRQDGMTGYDIIKRCRANGIPASSGTVYPHLKTMQDAGYISCREDGRRKVYSLTAVGRLEMEESALVKAPDFLKNAYLKSLFLAASMDWKSRAAVGILIDNVEEIKKYLIEYMDNLD